MSESVAPRPQTPMAAHEVDPATRIVLAIHRLVKECETQSDVSPSLDRLTEDALAAVNDYAKDSGRKTPRITFLNDTVFVGGSRLCSGPGVSRGMIATALHLGDMLLACGIGDVTFGERVPAESMRQFARLVCNAPRDPSLVARFTDGSLVRIRCARAPVREGKRAVLESAANRAVRTYAVAVVTVRAIHTEIRARSSEGAPRRLKRIAQALVTNITDSPRAMMALATLAVPADPATMSVATAIVGVAMSAQLTSDRHILVNIAMAGLSFDAGRPLLDARSELGAGRSEDGQHDEAALDDNSLDRLPASTAVAMIGIMGLDSPAQAWAAIVFEAHWMRRSARLGKLYRGARESSIAARVLAVARGFVEIRAAERAKPVSLERTLKRLRDRATDENERDTLTLLTGALGLFPGGTMVDLSTGERALVLETSANPLHVIQPRVRIVSDAKGKPLPAPLERDLRESDGAIVRWIRRTVPAKLPDLTPAAAPAEDRPTPVVAPSDDDVADILASFPKSEPPPAPSPVLDRSAMDRLLAEFVGAPIGPVAKAAPRHDLRAEESEGQPAQPKEAQPTKAAPKGVDDLLAAFIQEESGTAKKDSSPKMNAARRGNDR